MRILRIGIAILAVLCVWTRAWADDEAAALKKLTSLGVEEHAARTLLKRWAAREDLRAPDGLIEILEQASESGAPAELMVDKAAEGLSKRIPRERLLDALKDWGNHIGRAARYARAVRSELEPGDVSERETILRLGILQRVKEDDAWLRRLESQARKNRVNLPGFLKIGEAVGYLTRLGVEEKDAEELGALWMERDTHVDDIGKFVRAVEVGRDRMPPSQTARAIAESMQRGKTAEDVLQGIQDRQETRRESDADSRGPTERSDDRKKEKEKDD